MGFNVRMGIPEMEAVWDEGVAVILGEQNEWSNAYVLGIWAW